MVETDETHKNFKETDSQKTATKKKQKEKK